MFYEVNITLNGQHFFATDERSILTLAKLRQVVELFERKFPADEGYMLMISRQETKGQWITPDWVMGREEK